MTTVDEKEAETVSLKTLIVTAAAALAVSLAIPQTTYAQGTAAGSSGSQSATSPGAATQPPSGTATGTTDRQGQTNQPAGTAGTNQPPQSGVSTDPEDRTQNPNQTTPNPPAASGEQNRDPNAASQSNRDPNGNDRSRTGAPSPSTTQGATGTSGATQNPNDPNAANQQNANRGGRSGQLPATASPIPLMVFGAFVAFAAAGVLRFAVRRAV
jgi:hypothetical protein